MLSDTHPKAAEVQIELLRKVSVGKRARITRSLSASVIKLSRREVRRTMPDASEVDVLLRWLELVYGEQLAAGVRRRLSP